MIQPARIDKKTGMPAPTKSMLRDAVKHRASGVSISLPCIQSEDGQWFAGSATYSLEGTFAGITLWPISEPFEVSYRIEED